MNLKYGKYQELSKKEGKPVNHEIVRYRYGYFTWTT
jgi:hypothetical protein